MPESKLTLFIAPEALDEIDELSAFLEELKAGLGNEFIDQLGELFLDLLNKPFKWQYAKTKKEGIRRAIFFKPKVVVLYLVDDTELRVLSVKDTRSNWTSS